MKYKHMLWIVLIFIIIVESIYIINLKAKEESFTTNSGNQIIYNIGGANSNWEISNGFYAKNANSESFELGKVKYLKDINNIKEINIQVILKDFKKKKILLTSTVKYIEPSSTNEIQYSKSSFYSAQSNNISSDCNYSFEAIIKYKTFENKVFEEKIPLQGVYKFI